MKYDTQLQFTNDLLENYRLKINYIEKNLDILSADTMLMSLLSIPDNKAYLMNELETNCKSNVIYQIRALYCNYILFRLPTNDDSKCYAYIGPYALNHVSQKQIFEIADKYHINVEDISSLKHYYQNLPLIPDENGLLAIIYTLGKHLWGSMDAFSAKEVTDIPFTDLSAVSFKSESEKDIALRKKHLIDRYEQESQLIQAVASGQMHKVELILNHLGYSKYEEKTSNSLQNAKNYLIVLNTILRIAAANGTGHPLYVNRIASEYTHKIALITSVNAVHTLTKEMVRRYCLLVKNYSMKDYSPLVREILTNIESDLTADLSLNTQAELLSINASYLSTLFKKETGITLTKYVNQKRIEHAIFLLNSTDMQIQTIAHHCGIPEVNYFTKIFRKVVGQTPTEYRKNVPN